METNIVKENNETIGKKKNKKPSKTWIAAQRLKGSIVVYDNSLFEN